MPKTAKHRPKVEPIGHKPVSVLRRNENLTSSMPKRIDPRFDRAFGHFNDDLFSKSYAWVGELQEAEDQVLQEAAKKERDPQKKELIQKIINRRNSQRQAQKHKAMRQQVKKELLAKERDLLQQGIKQRAFFPSKRVLDDKFKEALAIESKTPSRRQQEKRMKRAAGRRKRRNEHIPPVGF